MTIKRNLKPKTLLYASPWLFGAASALLALIIAVFAVNNYHREKTLMKAALIQEGRAILSLVSSSTRGTLRRALMRGDVHEENWLQYIEQVLMNSAEHAAIQALMLVDGNGSILAHSDTDLQIEAVGEGIQRFLEEMARSGAPEANRIVESPGRDAYFQIVRLFRPTPFDDKLPPRMREMARGRMGRMMGEGFAPGAGSPLIGIINEREMFFVVELSLDDYTNAVKRQFLQIVILSIVLLLVGVGGILSLMLLQGFRGSQSRLRRVSALNDLLVSSLPVGIIATDNQERVRICNQSGAKLLALEGKVVIDRPLKEIMPDEIYAKMGEGDERLPGKRFEFVLNEDNNGPKSLHLTCLTIQNEDKAAGPAGMMLLVQDLSQLRELEKELQRSERDAAIGKMAAGVAHELRNPLSSIKGLALLLKKQLQKAEVDVEASDVLVEEVERLNRSISELLDYARPVQSVDGTFAIDEVVSRAVALIRSDAESAGIEIIELYQCENLELHVDQDKIIQVILNLCLNGIQEMHEGGLLTVTTRTEGRWVLIEIKDTGSGLSPDIKKRIFEPYFTTKENGTGLGLPLSARIVEDHRGMIGVASTSGEGTVMEVRLPVD